MCAYDAACFLSSSTKTGFGHCTVSELNEGPSTNRDSALGSCSFLCAKLALGDCTLGQRL